VAIITGTAPHAELVAGLDLPSDLVPIGLSVVKTSREFSRPMLLLYVADALPLAEAVSDEPWPRLVPDPPDGTVHRLWRTWVLVERRSADAEARPSFSAEGRQWQRSAWGEISWFPGIGLRTGIRLQDYRLLPTDKELSDAARATRATIGLALPKAGRRPGSGAYPTREGLVDELHKVVDGLRGRVATPDLLADGLGLSLSQFYTTINGHKPPVDWRAEVRARGGHVRKRR
jgi:hypothetical protein